MRHFLIFTAKAQNNFPRTLPENPCVIFTLSVTLGRGRSLKPFPATSQDYSHTFLNLRRPAIAEIRSPLFDCSLFSLGEEGGGGGGKGASANLKCHLGTGI